MINIKLNNQKNKFKIYKNKYKLYESILMNKKNSKIHYIKIN